jgi:hypothetical protein
MMISYHAPPGDPDVILRDTLERTATIASSEVIDRVFKEAKAHNADSRLLDSYGKVFDTLSLRLEQLIHTPADWNSYGSTPPTAVAIENARVILQRLRDKLLEPDSVNPSADGGIAFTFVSLTISRAEIECLNDGESYVLLYDLKGNSNTVDWPTANQRDQLATIECLSAHLRSEGLASNS